MKKSYIICGKPGAGKWTAVAYLREKFDGIIFRPSDLTRSILRAFSLPESRENLSKLMHILRKEFTQDIYIHSAREYIQKNPEKVIIFDGIRKLHFIDNIQNEHSCMLIFIDTDDHIRYERLKNRWEKSDEIGMSFEEFLQWESLESENENDDNYSNWFRESMT